MQEAAFLSPTYDESVPMALESGHQHRGGAPPPLPSGSGGGGGAPQLKTVAAHLLFKSLALVAYLLGNSLFGGYVLTFVLVTLLSAVDFWTVKNVTGRLLVGLRWWNYIDDAGNSHWRFESHEGDRVIHSQDSNAFWAVLFVTPVIWLVLAIAAFVTFSFMWGLLTLVGFGLNAVNVMGYIKCKKDAGKKLSALAGSMGGSILAKGMQWGASKMGG